MAGPKLRAFRTKVLYRALLTITAVGRAVPYRVGQRLGRLLGGLAWHLTRRERAKVLRNLAIAFPEWTEKERTRVARESFRHHGTSLFEVSHLWNAATFDFDAHTIFEGVEQGAALVAEGRSVVVFTAHCGNWEWLGAAIRSRGIPIAAVQRDRDDAEMHLWVKELRTRMGITTIGRGSESTARELVAALRRPGMLGFLIDQSLRTESVRVPFFGRDALTPIGPARLAIRTEAVAMPVFVERLPDGRHLVRCLEPVHCRRGDDPAALTARMTREIEQQIRRAPAQWVWMHDRWKYRAKWDVDAEGAVGAPA